MSYANFSRCRIVKCTFHKTDFTEASFSEAQFRDSVMRESTFVRTDFFRAPLADIDFTTCRLEALTLSQGCPELRKAIVGVSQAVDLAKMFGLVIR